MYSSNFLFSFFLLLFETMKKDHERRTVLLSNLLYVNYGLKVLFKQSLNILKCFCGKLLISTQAIKPHRAAYSKPHLKEKNRDIGFYSVESYQFCYFYLQY